MICINVNAHYWIVGIKEGIRGKQMQVLSHHGQEVSSVSEMFENVRKVNSTQKMVSIPNCLRCRYHRIDR